MPISIFFSFNAPSLDSAQVMPSFLSLPVIFPQCMCIVLSVLPSMQVKSFVSPVLSLLYLYRHTVSGGELL